MTDKTRYGQRGVSSSKEDVHKAIANTGKGLFPKAFCKILPDLAGENDEYCTVMHADGAGTKSSLAYVYWKETRNTSVWKGIAQDSIVMNLDDLLCVGATENIILSSSIGRNKNNIPGEVITALIEGTEEFLSRMRSYGVNIVSAGGETADVGDLVRTVIVDSSVFCRMRKEDVIDNSKIRSGDVIVGLSSFGQSTYENSYNGGIGSNGLTSARHDLFAKYIAKKYPESYDPRIPSKLVYSGKYKLTDKIEIPDKHQVRIGELLLSPTRTYAPVIRRVFEKYRDRIHGMIHCSGGGQTKILNFIEELHVIKENMFETPLLFRIIREQSGTSWKEMYRVFNMGHRMEIYVPPEIAEKIVSISAQFNVDARIIGRVEKAKEKKLTIHSEHGTFIY